MSEYQYYEFLAVDHPLSERQQAEVRALSTRARVTATSFTNEYQWGNFRGDPRKMMERYYDAHLYLTNWGTHQVMLRLPRTLLSLEVAGQYCIDPHVAAWSSGKHLILDLTSEDESGDWVEGAEDSLPAIVGVRAELAAGDLRALYLAWLAAYGTWERDEDAFDYDEDGELEPPVPAGLGALTAPQRALTDFLRLDADLLKVAAQASPPWPRQKRTLTSWPDGSGSCRPVTRTSSSTGLPKAMEPRSRWNCAAGSAVTPPPPETAVPAVRSPNCWTPPPKPGANASDGPKLRTPHRRAAAHESARWPARSDWTTWPATRKRPGRASAR